MEYKFKYLKTYEAKSYEAKSYEELNFGEGDLVFCKNEGYNGLVGLITSNIYTNEDDDQVVDVYFRGYNGDILPELLDDITIIDEDNLYILENKSDYTAYKSIAKKEGLLINTYKYDKYFDDRLDDEE